MGVMKTIAVDLAEGTLHTKEGTRGTLYSYDKSLWFSNPTKAYSVAIKLGRHPDQNLELEEGDFERVLSNENGEYDD